MSGRELPEGWTEARLDDCALVTQGQSPPGSSYNSTGEGVAFFQGKAEFTERQAVVGKWTTEPKKKVRGGAILLSVRAPVGPTNLAPVDCAIGRGLAGIEPYPGVDRDYLLWAIRSTVQALASQGSGSTFDAVGGDLVRAHVIPLAPENEQRRIVEELERRLSHIDAAKASLLSAAKRLAAAREAIVAVSVTGRLTSQAGADEVDPTTRQEETSAELDRLPPGWDWHPLGDLATMSLGKMVDSKKRTGRNLTPYLRNINVRWFNFVLSDVDEMDILPSEFERVSLQEGDLVICEGGEPGRCAVWRGAPFAIQKALHRVRPKEGVEATYLALVLRWWTRRHGFDRYITGTTIKHLPKEKLRLLPVPLPPSDEQRRIVAEAERRLSLLSAAESVIKVSLHRCEQLRRSLLAAAFTGKLVPQDPGDEPAEALLERVRTARAATQDTPAPRRRASRVKKEATA